MAKELYFTTIAEANRAFAARKLSPVELTRAYLDRIATLDRTLFSYLLVTADRALSEAAEAEAEIMRSGPRGPMHGIPYGLKDIYETKGLRTTAHSKLLADQSQRTIVPYRKDCVQPAAFCLASRRHGNSPWADRRLICPGHRHAIRGI